eukprot:TRINITY_DN411_c0_g1_i2.p2 TRINITY_DN411_c0_g1~~TRINITY_DN411_c0_g1_i2.p2  ORF type:complete len:147 (+),score=35.43 TRINITY_DN411_c0_g1_i2:238-678(+)
MEGGLLQDVVVGQCEAILELLSIQDETLLVRCESLLLLDLGLDVTDEVRRLDFEVGGLSSEGLDEDLHSSTTSEFQMEGGPLRDVVVGQREAILELLSREAKSLLVWWGVPLVLDLGLDAVDGVRRLDIDVECFCADFVEDVQKIC